MFIHSKISAAELWEVYVRVAGGILAQRVLVLLDTGLILDGLSQRLLTVDAPVAERQQQVDLLVERQLVVFELLQRILQSHHLEEALLDTNLLSRL